MQHFSRSAASAFNSILVLVLRMKNSFLVPPGGRKSVITLFFFSFPGDSGFYFDV